MNGHGRWECGGESKKQKRGQRREGERLRRQIELDRLWKTA